jgi:hypothetical protein
MSLIFYFYGAPDRPFAGQAFGSQQQMRPSKSLPRDLGKIQKLHSVFVYGVTPILAEMEVEAGCATRTDRLGESINSDIISGSGPTGRHGQSPLKTPGLKASLPRSQLTSI